MHVCGALQLKDWTGVRRTKTSGTYCNSCYTYDAIGGANYHCYIPLKLMNMYLKTISALILLYFFI